MNEETIKNIENLETGLLRLINKESVLYFLIYDTKNNPRASVKYIYDLALSLKGFGYNSKMLITDNSYTGVKNWLDDTYTSLEHVSIKDDKPLINVDDFLFVPEYYSNVLPQLMNIKCSKIMIVQQKEYIFDTLKIGSKWIDFGFDRCITTSKESKRYIDEYFPETITYVIPPFIDDIFKPSENPQKPYVAIHCRERSKVTKIISEFYLKYPHLRWITFRDMVQMSYNEFAESLKECMVSVWIDAESTFGTFPIESMKCNVPVIGKIPDNRPDWLSDNCIWVTEENDINDMLSSFITSWIDNQELYEEFEEKMKESVKPYNKENFESALTTIINTIYSNRMDIFNNSIKSLKTTE